MAAPKNQQLQRQMFSAGKVDRSVLEANLSGFDGQREITHLEDGSAIASVTPEDRLNARRQFADVGLLVNRVISSETEGANTVT